jgi:hypothetical protein
MEKRTVKEKTRTYSNQRSAISNQQEETTQKDDR